MASTPPSQLRPPEQTPSAKAAFCRGLSDGMLAATPKHPAYLVFTVPGTLYKLHLVPEPGQSASKGAKLVGTITCDARRVDRVAGGGRFVEPLVGRPRRVQGTIIAVDAANNHLVLDCGGGTVPGFEQSLVMTARLTDARNRAAEYHIGELVCFDCPGESKFELKPSARN